MVDNVFVAVLLIVVGLVHVIAPRQSLQIQAKLMLAPTVDPESLSARQCRTTQCVGLVLAVVGVWVALGRPPLSIPRT